VRSIVFLAAIALLFGCIAAPEAPAPGQPAAPAGEVTPPADGTTPPAEETPSAEEAPETPPAGPAPEPTTTLKHEEFTYNSGSWKIYGTLYDSEAETPQKLVILVPMLGETRDSYPISFIEELHDDLPDAMVLAIDPRGHGKSTNLGTWESFDMLGFKDMKTDIVKAKYYLEADYPAIRDFYVVGASIGSTSAINAGAQDKTIDKIVMLSPGMEYREVDISSSLDEYPHHVLVVASSGDSYSMQSISEIEQITPATSLHKKMYSGSAHGTDMFAATEGSPDSLENVIIEFLK